MATPADAVARLLEVFDLLEIPYEIGGSVASSAHGIPRTTLDVDIVVDVKPEQIEDLAVALSRDFYADPALIREAFAHGRAANLIHFETAWKFDLFPLKGDEYSRTEFSRRITREIRPDGTEPIECTVATAEDTILRKLEWYRAGAETSERQWNDLRGIVAAAGQSLDFDYLRRWATSLKIDDLLETLLAEKPN